MYDMETSNPIPELKTPQTKARSGLFPCIQACIICLCIGYIAGVLNHTDSASVFGNGKPESSKSPAIRVPETQASKSSVYTAKIQKNITAYFHSV
jgi:hypothetical protein